MSANVRFVADDPYGRPPSDDEGPAPRKFVADVLAPIRKE